MKVKNIKVSYKDKTDNGLNITYTIAELDTKMTFAELKTKIITDTGAEIGTIFFQ